MTYSNLKETAMTTTTVHKWGNGLGVLIPRQLAEKLKLGRGAKVDLALHDDVLELRPIKSYRVEDLLRDYTGPKPTEYEWGEPMGKEMW
jgi:antitoxin MazE